MKKLFTLLLFIPFAQSLVAQTTLSLGDLAIIGYNADDVLGDDDFSFILLTDITSGTVVHFTDFGWCSGVDITGFQSIDPCGESTGALNDGAITWTATSALSCGTQVRVACKTGLTASTGTVTGLVATDIDPAAYMSLATGGDQIFAFQGTLGSPNLITGINMNGDWDATMSRCALTSTQSTKPAVLTAGSSIAIAPEVDNATYNCSVTFDSPANLRAAIFTLSNWNTDNTNPYTLPLPNPFGCSACTAPTGLTVTNITDTAAILSWTGGVAAADRYQMRWRAVGETDWQARNTFDESGFRHVKVLEPATEYEWIIRTRCGVGNGDSSDWASGPNFTTLAGCGPVQDVTVSNIQDNQVDASWPSHAGATEYLLRFKPTSGSDWRARRVDGSTTSTTLRNLVAGTEYEYILRVYCETGLSRRGEFGNFTTPGTPPLRLAAPEDEGSEFVLYPNPTQGGLTVEFGAEVDQAAIEITNALGQRVYSNSVNSTDRLQMELNVQAGVYFVTVRAGEEQNVMRLLVE